MRYLWWLTIAIVVIYTGIWFSLASLPGPFWLEPEQLNWGYGIVKTASLHYTWDFNLNRPIHIDLMYSRGLIFNYLCSLAFRLPGDPLLWCRSIPLFFTFLTFFIVVFYYHRRGLLTYQRMLTWAIVYFGSSMILSLSYYTRPYTMLGCAMTITFILYWEGLMQFLQKNKKKAMLLWALGLIPVSISVIDQWQFEGVPALGLAVFTSIAAFNQRFSPIFGWIKRRSWWFLAGIMLLSPMATHLLGLLSWYKIGGYAPFILKYHSSYWDNCIGWLRFVLSVNVGLLALGYAFRSKEPMTFDRWMFVNGFLTAIICILFNTSAAIFESVYVYLPILIMIIGLGGMMDDSFKKTSFRKGIVAFYVIINIGVSWGYALEHNNVKPAVQWLNTHMTKGDVLITFREDSVFYFFGAQQLLPRAYPVNDTMDERHTIDLRNYIYSHPQGRIFYLYNDEGAFRYWLCQVTTGKELYPAIDLWSYLKLRIPSTAVIPGLRQCALVEFDHVVLLNGLDQLLRNGFDPKPRYTARDFFHHFIK